MRKVLSFVLVLAMVLGSFAFSFAAPATDTVGTDYEDAVNVLTELGVVTGYNDGSFKPSGIVTRAEMAAFIIRALGLNPNVAAATQFTDVPASHWASKYVAYAASLGVIYGRTATVFDPNATVSYDEAVTMLIRALGYNETSLLGVYPAAYVSKAKSLGIMKDMQAGSAGANRGDISLLVFRTLDKAMGKTNKEGIWEPNNIGGVGAAAVTETMLTRLDGQLYKPTTVGAKAGDAFVITDAVAGDAVINLRNMLGAYVTAYANDDNEIIAIKEVKSTFLTGDFDVAVNYGDAFSTGKQFDTSGDDYDITATSTGAGVTYFKNGVDGTTYQAITTKTYTIAVKMSGVKISEVYSIAEWDVNTGNAHKIDKYDLEELKLDDKLLNVKFALNNKDEIDLGAFGLFGADSLEDIKLNDIVYVYKSGSTITKIEVGTETVSGKVTAKSSDGDFMINGVEYAVSTAAGFDHGKLLVKNEVKVYLDYAGDIYYTEKISGDADLFAILLQAEDRDTSKIGTSEAKVKLFLADGTDKVFTVDKDADVMNSGNIVAISNGALVKYSLNSDGLVDSMVTATAVTKGALAVTKDGILNAKQIAADAKIFTYDGVSVAAFYPTSGALDEDDFAVSTYANILDTKNLEAVYHTANGVIDAIIIAGGSLKDDVYGVATVYGANDSSEGNYVDLLIDGKAAVRYNSKVTPAAIESLYKITFSASGGVTSLGAVNVSNGAIAMGATGGATTLMALTLDGYVLKVVSTGAFTTHGAFKENTQYTLQSDVVVYKWDATKYKVGSLSDLRGSAEFLYLFDTDDTADGVYNVVLVK